MCPSVGAGIALNLLKVGSVLNQPIGQLIIAAATVNEVVNIALLTIVENMVDDAALGEYVMPIAIMVVLIAVVGLLAVRVVPRLLERHVLPRLPQSHRPNAVLMALFVTAMGLIPACKYSGSSELLGAFLAGLCFCSDHAVHATWDRQVKRVAHWLMRFFFACTIGFSIPIAEIGSVDVLVKAVLLACAALGKLAVGCLARPLDGDHFWILALAWGEWGEMSFFIAAAAFKKKHGKDGMIDETTYNAICLAVLLSVVVCPAFLRRVLERHEARAKYQIAEAIADTADVSGAAHATYFCLQTKSHAHWEQSDHLQGAMVKMGCEVIDYRQWHPNDHFGLAHCVHEIYVRDDTLQLPTAMEHVTPAQADALSDRIDAILVAVRDALRADEHHDAEIRVQRWLPGCHVARDARTGDETLEANDDAAARVATLAGDANVYRGADGKLHGAGHGPWRLSRSTSQAFPPAADDAEAPGAAPGAKPQPRPPPRTPSSAALHALARHVFTPNPIERGLSSETLSAAFHRDTHHELDGFVHHDAHHPFALPDDDDHEKEDDLVFGVGASAMKQRSVRRVPSYHDVEVAIDSGYSQTLVELGSPLARSSASPRVGSSPNLAVRASLFATPRIARSHSDAPLSLSPCPESPAKSDVSN